MRRNTDKYKCYEFSSIVKEQECKCSGICDSVKRSRSESVTKQTPQRMGYQPASLKYGTLKPKYVIPIIVTDESLSEGTSTLESSSPKPSKYWSRSRTCKLSNRSRKKCEELLQQSSEESESSGTLTSESICSKPSIFKRISQRIKNKTKGSAKCQPTKTFGLQLTPKKGSNRTLISESMSPKPSRIKKTSSRMRNKKKGSVKCQPSKTFSLQLTPKKESNRTLSSESKSTKPSRIKETSSRMKNKKIGSAKCQPSKTCGLKLTAKKESNRTLTSESLSPKPSRTEETSQKMKNQQEVAESNETLTSEYMSPKPSRFKEPSPRMKNKTIGSTKCQPTKSFGLKLTPKKESNRTLTSESLSPKPSRIEETSQRMKNQQEVPESNETLTSEYMSPKPSRIKEPSPRMKNKRKGSSKCQLSKSCGLKLTPKKESNRTLTSESMSPKPSRIEETSQEMKIKQEVTESNRTLTSDLISPKPSRIEETSQEMKNKQEVTESNDTLTSKYYIYLKPSRIKEPSPRMKNKAKGSAKCQPTKTFGMKLTPKKESNRTLTSESMSPKPSRVKGSSPRMKNKTKGSAKCQPTKIFGLQLTPKKESNRTLASESMSPKPSRIKETSSRMRNKKKGSVKCQPPKTCGLQLTPKKKSNRTLTSESMSPTPSRIEETPSRMKNKKKGSGICQPTKTNRSKLKREPQPCINHPCLECIAKKMKQSPRRNDLTPKSAPIRPVKLKTVKIKSSYPEIIPVRTSSDNIRVPSTSPRPHSCLKPAGRKKKYYISKDSESETPSGDSTPPIKTSYQRKKNKIAVESDICLYKYLGVEKKKRSITDIILRKQPVFALDYKGQIEQEETQPEPEISAPALVKHAKRILSKTLRLEKDPKLLCTDCYPKSEADDLRESIAWHRATIESLTRKIDNKITRKIRSKMKLDDVSKHVCKICCTDTNFHGWEPDKGICEGRKCTQCQIEEEQEEIKEEISDDAFLTKDSCECFESFDIFDRINELRRDMTLEIPEKPLKTPKNLKCGVCFKNIAIKTYILRRGGRKGKIYLCGDCAKNADDAQMKRELEKELTIRPHYDYTHFLDKPRVQHLIEKGKKRYVRMPVGPNNEEKLIEIHTGEEVGVDEIPADELQTAIIDTTDLKSDDLEKLIKEIEVFQPEDVYGAPKKGGKKARPVEIHYDCTQKKCHNNCRNMLICTTSKCRLYNCCVDPKFSVGLKSLLVRLEKREAKMIEKRKLEKGMKDKGKHHVPLYHEMRKFCSNLHATDSIIDISEFKSSIPLTVQGIGGCTNVKCKVKEQYLVDIGKKNRKEKLTKRQKMQEELTMKNNMVAALRATAEEKKYTT